MKIISRNFGEIDFEEDKIIDFAEGIPGFKDLKKYIIIEDPESTFCYLQSVEEENICFIIINPFLLCKDYIIDIKDQEIEALGGGNEEKIGVYVIATVVGALEEATVNLVAPIIIQNEKKKGMQVILENTPYGTKHKIIDLLEKGVN